MRLLLRKMLLICFSLCLVLNFSKNASALKIENDELFGNSSGVILNVKTDKMIYKVGEDIVLTAYLKNKTGEPIDIIEPAIDQTSFMIEVINPEGKKDKLLDIGVNLKQLRLYPDKRIKFTTKFIPEMAGNYDIKVRYNGYKDGLSSLPIRVFVVSAPLIKIQPEAEE